MVLKLNLNIESDRNLANNGIINIDVASNLDFFNINVVSNLDFFQSYTSLSRVLQDARCRGDQTLKIYFFVHRNDAESDSKRITLIFHTCHIPAGTTFSRGTFFAGIISKRF
jgi:hypothetical protein